LVRNREAAAGGPFANERSEEAVRRRLIGFAFVVILSRVAAVMADAPLPEVKGVIALDGVEGRIDHFAVDEKAGRLYVAALGNHTVEVLDPVAGKRVTTLKGLEEPQGIAAMPDLGRFAVASGSDGKVRIYDAADFSVKAELTDLDDADNVRYDAKAKEIVVGYGRGALAFIDPAKGRVVREVKLAGHPESFQLEKDGARIFVNVPSAGHVAVVDRGKGAVVATWPIREAKGNFPMALDETHHRLLIGCRNPARLVVLDTESGRATANVEIVGDTDDVFYDAELARVYVSGGSGSVTVVQQKGADLYEVLANVKTAAGARTSYFVPAMRRLFVAVPHRGDQRAEVRVMETGMARQ